jgi:pimeloyl-ACP methyl ester carboxylesterase
VLSGIDDPARQQPWREFSGHADDRLVLNNLLDAVRAQDDRIARTETQREDVEVTLRPIAGRGHPSQLVIDHQLMSPGRVAFVGPTCAPPTIQYQLAVMSAARSGLALRERLRRVRTRDGRALALSEIRFSGRRARAGAPGFLLVHGFAQNRTSFTLGALPRVLLEHGARVFLGELRGHGASRRENEDAWTLGTHLDQDCPALIEAVRQATGAESVHWVGHSMGGLLGCALLDRSAPLASLTLMATPLVLGAGRPLVRLASLFAGPLAQVAPTGQRVPMDLFLGALARPLSSPHARGPVRWLQRATRLANPQLAEPEAVQAILANADPESPAIMLELARNAVLLRPRLQGIDLVAAVRAASLPVAAVVGTADIFAPRAAVAPLDEPGHAGPRTILEIEGGTHVDVTIGHHVPATAGALWDFLAPTSPAGAGRSSRRGRSAGGRTGAEAA